MAVWLWSFMFLLAGASGQTVKYPDPVCAVKGSTVNLPCTFTPLRSSIKNGEEIFLRVIRVRWCQNHPICQGTTPSVYDSKSMDNQPRYRYLGDMEGNCTLQIQDVQNGDEATLRFRMEVNHTEGHFTDQSGVNVKVVDSTNMTIISPSGGGTVREGGKVTLCCTSVCTFHRLEVTWFRDDQLLSEPGPALHLGPLTAEDSGNYSCGLKNNKEKRSLPYMLRVNKSAEALPLIMGVVLGLLLALSIIVLALFIIKRRRAAAKADQRPKAGEVEQRCPSGILSNIQLCEGGDPQKETSQVVHDFSYASVQFRNKNQARPVVEAEDATIYSSVVN